MHIGDFLTGVIHMDAVETGAYIMLIMAHYQAGEEGLPNDDKKLSRIAKVTPRKWAAIKDTVMEKFDLENDMWCQKRVVNELKRVRDVSQRQSAKALKLHNPPDATAQPRHSQPITNNQEPITPESKKGFSVMSLIDDRALQRAKDNAPGWDIYYLGRVYNEGVASGQRERPDNPSAAFPVWVKNYTKGKRP